jgi:hypothetical protein
VRSSGCSSPAYAATAVPNTCRITGTNKARAVQIFGKGANVHNYATSASTPPNLGSYCAVGLDKPSCGDLEVELYDVTYVQTLLTSYGETSGVAKHPLSSLETGAAYLVSTDRSVDPVLFSSARYAVLIDTNLLGGQKASAYPTEKQFVLPGSRRPQASRLTTRACLLRVGVPLDRFEHRSGGGVQLPICRDRDCGLELGRVVSDRDEGDVVVGLDE